MRIIDSTPDEFREFIKDRKVVCFGSGDYFSLFVFDFGDVAEIIGAIDNDEKKHGTIVSAGNISVLVQSISEFTQKIGFDDTILVITASAYLEMISQLQTISAFDSVLCYVYAKIKYSVLQPVRNLFQTCDTPWIPPVIHYCWFGGNPLPENLRYCINSWCNFCPGYEIIEWNEKNYDCRKNEWTKTAWEQKKWTYLTDYARIDIIATYGGIYLDTDVELLRTLEPLRYNKGFVATEAHGGINFGSGLGALPGSCILQELLVEFGREFENGVNFCRNVGRETEVFWRYGYKLNGEFQVIKEVVVLPFNVLTPRIADTNEQFFTNATVGVHYFNRGWKNHD